MNPDRKEELAALHAVGALDGADLQEWLRFLETGDSQGKAENAGFADVAALLAAALAKPERPSPALKTRLMEQVQRPSADGGSLDRALQNPFTFIKGNDTEGWKALPVRGAWIKLLSIDYSRNCAVLLGRLEPGTHYPAHQHVAAEDIYVLTGDLHIGGQTLNAGDFHRAAAGSSHPINYSEHGCTILAVLSTEHVLTKFALA